MYISLLVGIATKIFYTENDRHGANFGEVGTRWALNNAQLARPAANIQ